MGDEEFEHIFRDREGWTRFRREFPGSDGTLRFSRVGFDRDVTQAMLYAGQQFDWKIGSGGFWLFSKIDGESGRKLAMWETGSREARPLATCRGVIDQTRAAYGRFGRRNRRCEYRVEAGGAG